MYRRLSVLDRIDAWFKPAGLLAADAFSDALLLDYAQSKYADIVANGDLDPDTIDQPPRFFVNSGELIGDSGDQMQAQLAWRESFRDTGSKNEGRTCYNLFNLIERGILQYLKSILSHEFNHKKVPGTFADTVILMWDIGKAIQQKGGITLNPTGKQMQYIQNAGYSDLWVNYLDIQRDLMQRQENPVNLWHDGSQCGVAMIYRHIRDEWRYTADDGGNRVKDTEKDGQVQAYSPFWAIILRSYEILCESPDNFILQDTYTDIPAKQTVQTYTGPVELDTHQLDAQLEQRAQALAALIRDNAINQEGEETRRAYIDIMHPFLPAQNEQLPDFDFMDISNFKPEDFGEDGIPVLGAGTESDGDADAGEHDEITPSDPSAKPIPKASDGELKDIARKLVARAIKKGSGDDVAKEIVKNFKDIAKMVTRDPNDLTALHLELMKYDLFDVKAIPELDQSGRPTLVKRVPLSRIMETDFPRSVGTHGIIVPGVTTERMASLRGVKRGQRAEYPHLHIIKDMSGSMETPSGRISATCVATGRGAFSWLRLPGRRMVRITAMSGNEFDSGWTRSEDDLLKPIMYHDGGDTHIPVKALKDVQKGATQSPYFSIWYTDLTDFQEVTDRKLRILHDYIQSAVGVLVFLTPQKDGSIGYKAETVQMFIDAGVPAENIYQIKSLSDLSNITIEVLEKTARAMARRTQVHRGTHAEQIIRSVRNMVHEPA